MIQDPEQQQQHLQQGYGKLETKLLLQHLQ
jgi:hypothetical protein